MAKYADIHMFPSERLRDYMLQYLDVDMKKTRIVPHIVLDETHTPNISSKIFLELYTQVICIHLVILIFS